MERDFLKIIRDLEKRVKILEQNVTLRNLTFPEDGKIVVPIYSADPSAGESSNGQIYYNDTTNKFRGYENGSWANII